MDSTVRSRPAVQIWWLQPTHNWRYDNLSNLCDCDNPRYRDLSKPQDRDYDVTSSLAEISYGFLSRCCSVLSKFWVHVHAILKVEILFKITCLIPNFCWIKPLLYTFFIHFCSASFFRIHLIRTSPEYTEINLPFIFDNTLVKIAPRKTSAESDIPLWSILW